jgi:hypothetical protein
VSSSVNQRFLVHPIIAAQPICGAHFLPAAQASPPQRNSHFCQFSTTYYESNMRLNTQLSTVSNFESANLLKNRNSFRQASNESALSKEPISLKPITSEA